NLHALNLHALNLHALNLHALNLHALNLRALNLQRGPDAIARLELDAAARLDTGIEGVLDRLHLRNRVSSVDQRFGRSSPSDADAQLGRLIEDGSNDLLHWQVAVAQHDVQFVQD